MAGATDREVSPVRGLRCALHTARPGRRGGRLRSAARQAWLGRPGSAHPLLFEGRLPVRDPHSRCWPEPSQTKDPYALAHVSPPLGVRQVVADPSVLPPKCLSSCSPVASAVSVSADS